MIAMLTAVVFLSFVGVGLIIPLFPFFGARVGAAPEMITSAMAVFALGQLVATPFWGWASDRIGRRPVLIISLLGASVSYLVLAYADSVAMLLMSRLLGGLMTGIGAVAFSIVADVTTGHASARGMGRISAAFSLGFILGPAIGGLLAGSDAAGADFRAIGLVAAGINAAAAAAAFVLIRETRPARQAVGDSRQPSLGLWTALRDPTILRLNLANLLFSGSYAVVDSTLPLYASLVHSLSPREIGLAFTWMGIVSVLVQALALDHVVRLFGLSGAVIAGLASFGVGQLLLAASSGSASLNVAIAFLAGGMALFLAPASSLVSAAAPAGERGALLGGFQGAGNLGRTVTPALSGLLFSAVGGAAPFLAAAVLVMPAIFLVLGVRRRAHALGASVL